MLPLLTVRASAWTLQAIATLPDTIIARQIVERGWFDQVAHVAGGLLVIILLLVAILMVPAVWYVHRSFTRWTDAIEGLRRDFAPLLSGMRTIMDAAEGITGTVRTNVERLSETVSRFDGQLREVADITGARVRDFDDLLGAVHDEAEDLFISASAATRGIRAGVKALGGLRGRARRKRKPERESDILGDGDERDSVSDVEPNTTPVRRPVRRRRRRR